MLVTDVASLINADGFGTEGTDLFKGSMPPDPDSCVVVSEYGGAGPHTFFGGAIDENPHVQIRARGAAYDYATPRQKIENIYRSLMVRGAVTVNSTRYLSFTPIAPPFPFEHDENKRWIFAVNFDVLKELSTST